MQRPGFASHSGAPQWIRAELGARWQLRWMRWIGIHAPGRAAELVVDAIALWLAARPRRAETRASAQYLRRALGRRAGLRDLWRHNRAFGRAALDRVGLLSRGEAAYALEAQGHQLIHALLAERRGAVLLGAHYGSFEALRAFDRALPGLVVRYLMYTDHAAESTRLLHELNPEVAAQVIPLRDGLSAMLAVAEALERGEFVAFLGDRLPDPGKSRRPGAVVEAMFLGAPIRLPGSPYAAALAARAPLIFCAAVRTGRRRYEIEFDQLYDGAPAPRAARRALVAQMVQSYARHLERLCRRDPYQWFNFFDIWGR